MQFSAWDSGAFEDGAGVLAVIKVGWKCPPQQLPFLAVGNGIALELLGLAPMDLCSSRAGA